VSDLAAAEGTRRFLGFTWPERLLPEERRSLVAGGLGWLLDAMDVMLYSYVLAHLMRELGMDKGQAGFLNSLTLLASALGGFLFGLAADRIGRTRALMLSILIYSGASGACGLADTVVELAIFRFILGLGMGGEWTSGAALVAESWRAEHRGKGLALMQSFWAVGEMLAAAVVAVVLPRFGWRAVFFVGIAPALLVFWIRRGVEEPRLWMERKAKPGGGLRALLRPDVRRNGLLATAMNTCAMFGYWGLFTWIPAYLSLPVAEGGRGLDVFKTTTWLVVMGVGKWVGYASFGFFADAFGRRRSYVAYLTAAAVLVPLYGLARDPTWLLVLGPFVALFGTGFFSGFGALAAEIFPTEIRATAMGLSYNVGRGLSATAPFIVGTLATQYGLGTAFFLQAAAFLAAAFLALALPETRGKALE